MPSRGLRRLSTDSAPVVGHLLFFESEEALVSSSPGMAARSERLICAFAGREGGRFWSGTGARRGAGRSIARTPTRGHSMELPALAANRDDPVGQHSVDFRSNLQATIGAPYDERLYQFVNR